MSQKEWNLFGDVGIIIIDPFINSINMTNVINDIERFIPSYLAYGLDSIYIGNFKEFERKETNAFYKDGAIYVSNVQDDKEDLVDDIIHELAHLVEEQRGLEIYGDDRIKKEFLAKRKKLYFLLKGEGYDINLIDLLNPEYSAEFDEFLYKEVGYPHLENIAMGLFYSPYAVTSLKEYFANGFEAFFMKKDLSFLKNISPALYDTMEKLHDGGE